MTTKQMFADSYPIENGLIQFPRDATIRRQLQPEGVMKHPAKMNLFLLVEAIKYFTKPGDTIVDCFGGVGTTGIGALMGRNVILIEIEEPFHELQKQELAMWNEDWDKYVKIISQVSKQDFSQYPRGNLVPILGDNVKVLPVKCDHMIFSPPYANDLDKHSGTALTEDIQESADLYTAHKDNFGNKPDFNYRMLMKKCYKGVGESVKTGGTVTITHRDRSRAGKRILFAQSIMKEMFANGFGLEEHNRWSAPGTLAARINEAKGALVINDEDILTFRKK